jgi:NAD(P)-dependent dehydrogenase (short-subunit alcohol dehydrogenase family)
MIKTAVKTFGKLDAIWNNAGIQGETLYDISHCPEDMIDRYLNINVKGVWYGCHFAAPELVKTKGVILNTASFVASNGTIGCSTYSPTKGAIQTMTYTIAWELGLHGIRCNCISPYSVATPGTIGQGEKLLKLHKSGTATGELVEIDQVVNTALFLLSDESSGITGLDLRCDLGAGVRSMSMDFEAFKKNNPYQI